MPLPPTSVLVRKRSASSPTTWSVALPSPPTGSGWPRNTSKSTSCFRVPPLREFPTDELEHRLHPNLPHFPYTIDDQHPNVYFYSVHIPQTRLITGKVDTLMGLGKKHGAHDDTFAYNTRSIQVDISTEAWKIMQARNAPSYVGQDAELGLLGHQPQRSQQYQQNQQPQQQHKQQHPQQHERQQQMQQKTAETSKTL